MKRLILPILFALVLPSAFSCSVFKGYNLTEADAANALRQMLELGARDNLNGAFSKEMIISTVFPEPMRKALNTLNQLGLTNEVDRFTTTLSTAAETTASRSIPIFVSGISRMSFSDAMRIVKSGGTSATDYLRANVGTELRTSIKPVMQQALEEYKLTEQWTRLMKPVQNMVGDRFNLDLANLMAGIVSEKMFQKIAEKEQQVRSNASARTTPLLKKVFSRSWQ